MPFRGNIRRILTLLIEEDPVAPRRLADTIARDLETFCLKAMARERDHCYATSADLTENLRAWLDGRPLQARPVGRLGRLALRVRRRPLLSVLVAAIGLALVTGVGGVTRQWRRAESARRLQSESLDLYRIALADREIVAGDTVEAENLLDECEPDRREWEWRSLRRRSRNEPAVIVSDPNQE